MNACPFAATSEAKPPPAGCRHSGRSFVQSVQQLDYTVIMGTTVFYGAFLVFMVIVVDLLYGLIDPRVRLE